MRSSHELRNDQAGMAFCGGRPRLPWAVEDRPGRCQSGEEDGVADAEPGVLGAATQVDRLIWQSFGSDASTLDAATVISALRAGEIDVADPPAQFDLLGRLTALAPALVTEVRPGLTFDHLDFNVMNFHLEQKAVRQAIATALDRSTVVRSTVGQIDPAARMLNNRIHMINQPDYVATARKLRRLLEPSNDTGSRDEVALVDALDSFHPLAATCLSAIEPAANERTRAGAGGHTDRRKCRRGS